MRKIYKYLSDSSKISFEKDHELLLQENLITDAEIELVRGINGIIKHYEHELGLVLDFSVDSKNTFWVLDNSPYLAVHNQLFSYSIFNRERMSCKTIFHELLHGHSTSLNITRSRFTYFNQIQEKSGISYWNYTIFPFRKISIKSGLYYPKNQKEGDLKKKLQTSEKLCSSENSPGSMSGQFLNEGLTDFLSINFIERYKSEVTNILRDYDKLDLDHHLVDRIGGIDDVSYKKNYFVIELLYNILGDITQMSESELSDILLRMYVNMDADKFGKILTNFFSFKDFCKIYEIHHSKKWRGEEDEKNLDDLIYKLYSIKELGDFSLHQKDRLEKVMGKKS